MSFQIKRILVAKDLSADSLRVLRYALGLGSKFDAEIHILHVMPIIDQAALNMVSLTMGPEKLAAINTRNEAAMAEQTRLQIKTIVLEERQRDNLVLSTEPAVEVHHGEPALMILDSAERLDVDMIILGRHSKGTLRHAFLGSVADKVLRKTQRMVLMVPPAHVD